MNQANREAVGATRTDWTVALCLLAAGLLTSVLGSLLNLYDRFAWFDEAIHCFNFFAIALVLGLFAYRTVLDAVRDGGLHRLMLVLIVAGLGLAAGALWEIAEWAYDGVVRPNAILGKTDTILDLVVDSVGAVVAGFVSLRMSEK